MGFRKLHTRLKICKMKLRILFIIGAILVAILIVFIIPTEKEKIYQEEVIEEEIYDEFSHIQEPHWTHIPLTYKIVNCTDYQKGRVIKAFNQIQNETENIVSFEEYNGEYELGGDFMIYCHEDYHESYGIWEEITYVVADGIYYPYEDYPNKILYSDINFYGITETTYSGGCVSYPDTEIHEILHGFGFDNVNDTKNIMNEIHVNCPYKINQNILDKLIEIYSISSPIP